MIYLKALFGMFILLAALAAFIAGLSLASESDWGWMVPVAMGVCALIFLYCMILGRIKGNEQP